MRKYLLSSISFLLLINSLQAQKLPWAISAGNSSNQFSTGICTDKSGNIVISGFFKGTNMDFDPSSSVANLSSSGDNDIFVAKYNNVGQYLWAFALGGSEYDVAYYENVDSMGNIYVSGAFRGTVDFDPSPTATFNLTSNDQNITGTSFGGDAFLAKYTKDGTFLWALNVGSTSIGDFGGPIAFDINGDVLWTGTFTGTSDFDPSPNVNSLFCSSTSASFLAKYSPSGNLLWAKPFVGSNVVNSTGRSISVDKTGSIYLFGFFDGTIDLNPGTGNNLASSNGCQDIFLVKLDSAANYTWGFNIGGSGCDYPWKMGLDSSDNIYLAGFYTNTVDFNPSVGSNNMTSKGGSDAYVVKYDKNGNYIFSNSMGGSGDDYAFGLILNDNGYTVSGSFTGTADFDAGPNAYNLVSLGGSDVYISRYDLSGKFENVFRIGGALNEEVRDMAVYRDNQQVYSNGSSYPYNESIYVTGRYASANVDFDPSSSKLVYSSNGGDDIYIAKYTDLELVNNIKGTVFLDRNSNGIKEPTENYLDNVNIWSHKLYGDTIMTGTLNGQFGFVTDSGNYITKSFLNKPYYNAVPVSFNTSHPNYFNTDSVDFAMQAIPGQRDLTISLFPLSPVRPGFNAYYSLIYENVGTDTVANGTIELIKDYRFPNWYSNPMQSMVSGDTLRWNFSNLKPGETASIYITFYVAPPPIVNVNDTIATVATIFPVSGDNTPNDNTTTLIQNVIGSYDPNDKTEKHGGRIKLAQLADDYLQYTIRFQNTGNDTAFNILIKDTLNSKLDWRTLQMISASHDYKFTLTGGKFCEWKFNNIKLVDSIKNKVLSNGYLVFKIKAKQNNLSIGDTITNRASIYFDYNPPIQTNINYTIVDKNTLPVKLISFQALRNGKQNLLEWLTSSEMNVAYYEIQKSEDGRNFKEIGKITVEGNSNFIRKYHFADIFPFKITNYYRLKIVDKDGKFEYSIIRLLNNNIVFDVVAYPNPVKDKISLKIESNKSITALLEVINMEGKIVTSGKLSINEGISNQTIDVSKLSYGSYIVNIKTNDGIYSLTIQKL